MQAVKMLLLGLTALFISGCCEPQLQQCKTPTPRYPDINNTSCNGNPKCVYEKVVGNYYKMQEYAENLEAANSVCK
jgi:hypothetical protein